MKFLLFLLFLISCSSYAPSNASGDIFNKIFHIRATQNLKDLENLFGPPKEVKDAHKEPLLEEHVFDTKEGLPLYVFINKDTNQIESFVLTYWVNFDAYAFLKKRFKDYKWIETGLPIRTDLDYAEELHKVEIPELGISFEYDNQDPLRRPMWIFFKGKE